MTLRRPKLYVHVLSHLFFWADNPEVPWTLSHFLCINLAKRLSVTAVPCACAWTQKGYVCWTLIKWICVLVLHIAIFSTQWSLERPWYPMLPLAFLFYMTHRGKQNFAVFCYIHSGMGTVADLGLYREDHPRRKVSLSQIPEKGKMVGHDLGWRCQFKKGRSYNFQAGCEEGFQWKRKQVEIKIISEPFMLIKSFLMEIMAFSKVSMVSFARLVWPADTELRR